MMHRRDFRDRCGLCSWLLVATMLAGVAQAQTAAMQQVIELEPGWNAIYVRLQPNQPDIATVFADLPIESVWRWIPDDRGAEFISDPAEDLRNLEGWFGWFPEPRPDAFLSNLFRISANTAYLVHLGGTQARQITITGRPVFARPPWVSNAFTLTGLPVSEIAPPTFAGFFSASEAHAGQPLYALSNDGRWRPVDAATTTIDADTAYWIHTRGNSTYQGPSALVLDQGESLEFARTLNEIQIVLRNRTDLAGSFQIRRLGNTALPLRYRVEDPETGDVAWPALRDVLVQDAPAGSEVFLDFGLRRSEFVEDRMEQILEITDEFGGRILLTVGGDSLQPIVAAARTAGETANTKTRAPGGGTMAGLWLGAVQVNAVSEAQRAGVVPTATGDSFEQRVLVHVDSGGQARLLKDVILMWQDGTRVPSDQDPSLDEVDTPGRYVLITNKDLIPLYTGAVNRDGAQVGQRYSTIAYDFPGEYVELTGEFGPGGQNTATLVLEPDYPTNPFRHQFHPDHDNKDAQFLNFRQEAFQVTRELQFEFAVDDPLGADPPGWGSSIVGGTFREAISGLHKNTIFVSGSFRLRRISLVPVLNQ